MVRFCEGECMGCSLGDEPQTLMRCHSCGLPQLNEACGWKSAYRQARRIVHDGSVWRGFVRENAWGVARGMNP